MCSVCCAAEIVRVRWCTVSYKYWFDISRRWPSVVMPKRLSVSTEQCKNPPKTENPPPGVGRSIVDKPSPRMDLRRRIWGTRGEATSES